MSAQTASLSHLDDRARTLFREIVEAYLESGQPIGSRTLSRDSQLGLSPATIRNVMADLSASGLLDAAHISAGRAPTAHGLKLFVDGLLEVGDLKAGERKSIESRIAGSSLSLEDTLAQASKVLSGLAGAAGLVLAPSGDAPLRHVEFVSFSAGQALAVLVYEDGRVENRIMNLPTGMMPSTLVQAGNYLSSRLKGRRLSQAISDIRAELTSHQAELDAAAQSLIETGLADWSGGTDRVLIVRGRAKLLDNLDAGEDLQRVQQLIEDLERKEELIQLMERANNAKGVKIFIGAESSLFAHSGSSLIVAPYMNAKQDIVGALGIIGPMRLNYAKVVPMIDYTAQLVGTLLDRRDRQG